MYRKKVGWFGGWFGSCVTDVPPVPFVSLRESTEMLVCCSFAKSIIVAHERRPASQITPPARTHTLRSGNSRSTVPCVHSSSASGSPAAPSVSLVRTTSQHSVVARLIKGGVVRKRCLFSGPFRGKPSCSTKNTTIQRGRCLRCC